MTRLKGIGLSIEVAATFQSLPILQISREKPAVVALDSGHGLVAGDVFYPTCLGMHQLNGVACLVSATSAGGVSISGIDSTRYYSFLSGSLIKCVTWTAIHCPVAYAFRESASSQISSTKIYHRSEQVLHQLPGNDLVKIDVRAKTSLSALDEILKNAADNHEAKVFRIRSADGKVRVFRGIPTMLSESLALGAIGVGSFSVSVIGEVSVSKDSDDGVIIPPIDTFYLHDGALNILTDEATNRLTWN